MTYRDNAAGEPHEKKSVLWPVVFLTLLAVLLITAIFYFVLGGK